jgi:RNA polymerase sigma-70 factor (ECF subfamily)
MSVGSAFEIQLAELLVRGTKEDLREFVLLAGPMIYTFLNRVGVSPNDRDDLYQETLIKIITCKHQFDVEKRITPWLFTIAVNLTRSKFRSSKEYYSIDDIGDPVCQKPDSLEQYFGKELVRKIEEALLTLPLPLREAILICGFEQIDRKQAATILNIPEATLRTNLRRARIRLAEMIHVSSAEELLRASI